MRLRQELTLADATLLVVGNVVGAGIFTTSGFLAGELPHPLLFVGIWILGALITIFGALTYAELAGMFPQAGGAGFSRPDIPLGGFLGLGQFLDHRPRLHRALSPPQAIQSCGPCMIPT